jgi:5-formyltetrahydrofolate cyclo-ligase
MINKLNKQSLRKLLLDKRRLLTKQAIYDKSIKIAEKLIKSDKYQQSEKIMLYISTNSEVQTRGIIEYSLKTNKKVFVPLIIQDKHEIIPSLIKNYETEIAPGSLGIFQPKEEFQRYFPADILDLVIVPGVAFSEKGHRLGRGGGYYDRFLKRLSKGACTIGLAFEMQIVKELSLEKNDMPVDCIITEERIIQTNQDKR